MSSNIYAESAKPISEGNVTNATANPAPSPNAQPPPPAYGVNNAQSIPPINTHEVVMQLRPQFGAQQVPLQVQYQDPNAAHQYQAGPQTSYQAMGPIPVQNGMPMQQRAFGDLDWSFGLCECFDDMSACCMTCWCPCLTAGEIWEKGLEKSFFGGCCLFTILMYVPSLLFYQIAGVWCQFWALCYPCLWTGPLRQRRGIEGNYIGDCCCVCWCGCCHMIREVREAKLMKEELLTGVPRDVPIQTAMI